MAVLCTLVAGTPMGTNLGLVQVLWMLVSGHLLETRGAVIPGLSRLGLGAAAVRRAWATLGQGRWQAAPLLEHWQALVSEEGQWQAHQHAGYQAVAVDVTAFWRPRLQGCATTHFDSRAGKALPAIPVGIVARTGSAGTQRLGLPLALVRADPTQTAHATAAHETALLRAAVAVSGATDALVVDRGFGVRRLQAAGATRYVARLRENFSARRAQPPTYRGRGRRPVRGTVVRPLARRSRGRALPVTEPDRVECWTEAGVAVRAAVWEDLVLADGASGAPTFAVVAIHDPRQRGPLLLASPLPVSARTLRDLYADRWPVEQIPLVAKQLLGAGRQFVSAPETCQRLPELALLAGCVLSYLAATTAAVPTGFWDRRPRATPGRLRRLLAQQSFPVDFPFSPHIRQKRAVTCHLPTGFWAQRRPRSSPAPRIPVPSARPAA